MKIIFSKINFPTVPGGNIYHWKKADTIFKAPQGGKYLIAVTASAKSANQNKSKDDDDLRVSVDDYEFGKYEVHDEIISWKGFGTASSWDGAVLRGAEKTIYYFVELREGEHCLKFFADETPTLKEVVISLLDEGETIEFKEIMPPQNIKVDKKGVPWLGFIFLGVKPKSFSLSAITESASQKKITDGDNLKILINGRILPNPKTPSSDKYKNFYFSGDLNQGKTATLEITPKSFEFLEDSVELWYDEKPNATIKIEIFDSVRDWLENSLSEKGKKLFYKSVLQLAIRYFYLKGYEYSGHFLEHALLDNPQKLRFDNNHALSKTVKADQMYQKILSIIKTQIKAGVMNGQILLGDENRGMNIDFVNDDLGYSLHGLKKIEYKAIQTERRYYRIEMILFDVYDVYDFDAKDYRTSPIWIIIHMADVLETSQILQNFEIEIDISERIKI
ncbi:hypothetical protein HZA43_04385 [Candidatus Peregrinibacteria bacterium]|nr:hypothetical protein [Candidatus Peregrinibacteria bacterium]